MVNSRAKGKRGELRVVHLMQELYPKATRSAAQGFGGWVAPDVEHTPWWVEVKEGVRPNIWAAMEQAEEDRKVTDDARPPLVVTHKTGGRTLVTMQWPQFRELVLEARQGRESGGSPVWTPEDCHKHGVQNCHACPETSCGDNMQIDGSKEVPIE